jgi:aminoglycoside 6'-N-acetyltransferase
MDEAQTPEPPFDVSGAITFRPMRADDLPRLHRWLNAPHLREFYQKAPISSAEVEAEFGPDLRGEHPTFHHLALLSGRPFGKLQCYRNLAYPDYAAEIGVSEGVSIDLFIGEAELIGRGVGRRMLRAYALEVALALHPGETRVFICHETANARARACSKAAGFTTLGSVIEAGRPSELLVLDKSSAVTDGR